MSAIVYLDSNPWHALCLLGIFSLLLGSFFNVVIYRLPKMMEAHWKHECQLISGRGQHLHLKALIWPAELSLPAMAQPSKLKISLFSAISYCAAAAPPAKTRLDSATRG